MQKTIIKNLLKFKRDKISNYVIPGLDSYLILDNGLEGKIRLFESTRMHQEPITPHSHRFDFTCCVLSGNVINRVWTYSHCGDEFIKTTLKYSDIGEYEKNQEDVTRFGYHDTIYNEGDCYSMDSEEIHSIYFSKGAEILFFEGPQLSDSSIILEPFVDDEIIPTFEVKPWMFKKSKGNKQ